MKKASLVLSLALLLSIFLISLALAEEDVDDTAGGDAEGEVALPPELEALQQELVGKKLVSPLAQLFGNQRINVHLELESGENIVVGIVIEKKIIKMVQIAEVNNPTLEVRTKESVVRSALLSPAPAATIRRALKDKHITVNALGFGNKLKFSIASGVAEISGLFSKQEIAPVAIVERKEAGMPVQPEQVTGGVVTQEKTGQKEEKKEASAEEKPPVKEGPNTHTVSLITGGFAVPSIEIKAGDTVSWVNDRGDTPNKGFQRALLLGTQKCSRAKSGFFQPGESFSWTFTEPVTCLFVDGLYTTQTMKVTVTK